VVVKTGRVIKTQQIDKVELCVRSSQINAGEFVRRRSRSVRTAPSPAIELLAGTPSASDKVGAVLRWWEIPVNIKPSKMPVLTNRGTINFVFQNPASKMGARPWCSLEVLDVRS